MSVPVHVRRFSSYANKNIEKLSKDKKFDHKVFFLNVRNADESNVIVLYANGHRDDPDTCDLAEFFAMQPHYAAELACRLEDAVNAVGMDFDQYRDKYIARKNNKNEQNQAT